MSTETRGTRPAASAESFHAEVLEAIITGHPGIRTRGVFRLYSALAPLVYRGTTEQPVKRRWQRELLDALEDADRLASYPITDGRVWTPVNLHGDDGA